MRTQQIGVHEICRWQRPGTPSVIYPRESIVGKREGKSRGEFPQAGSTKNVNLGHTYHLLKQYKRALSDLGEAIRLQPDDARSHYVRGAVYHITEDYELAIADYTKAVLINPDYANAYI